MARNPKKPWWKTTKDAQLSWFANFIVKIVTYSTELNITTDEHASVLADEAMFRYLWTYDESVRTFIAAFITYRRNIMLGKTPAEIGLPPVCPVITVPAAVMTALLNRIFAFVKSLKSQPGYTAAIGIDMQIIGADIEPFIPANYVANGTGKSGFLGITIDFVKGIFIDGMAIFCQRGSDPNFYELVRITKKGYLINSLNLVAGPETRKFYLMGIIDNELIGEPSPTFSVTWTSPPPPPTAAAPAAAKDEEAKTAE